jgi:hypothetical protein
MIGIAAVSYDRLTPQRNTGGGGLSIGAFVLQLD